MIATPGEPEEACFSSEPPILMRRPWPAAGTTADAAVRLSGGRAFDCLGAWMAGAHDWTGDGAADLVVTSTGGGAWLFAGPIEDGRDLAGGTALAITSGPYGGYGIAAGAVVDVDGDGAPELALVDLETRSARVWRAPIDPTVSSGPVLVAGPRPADLDGDGDADLVAADDVFDPATITAIALPGGGVRWRSRRSVRAARTGDLDGDGRAEIVTQGQDETFRVLRVP